MNRVAVLDDYQGKASEFADWGRLACEVVYLRETLRGPGLIEALAGFDTVVAMRERTAFPRSVLEALPELRLLVTTGMKNASIDIAGAIELGITVCGTGSLGPVTTELTWALLLAARKHIPQEHQAIREGGWQRHIPGDLNGKLLGLIGLGRLGRAMVPIAQVFGMRICAWSQNLTPEQAAEVGVDYVTLEELLQTSDIISINLMLSDRTRGLIGAAELAQMAPGTLLVNTSRGPIIDETALIEALQAGRINGAFDVFDTEPLPADHPLRTLDNVVLTPHLGYVSDHSFHRYYGEVVEDIEAFRAGTPVRLLTG